jgi:hypothetical protein
LQYKPVFAFPIPGLFLLVPLFSSFLVLVCFWDLDFLLQILSSFVPLLLQLQRQGPAELKRDLLVVVLQLFQEAADCPCLSSPQVKSKAGRNLRRNTRPSPPSIPRRRGEPPRVHGRGKGGTLLARSMVTTGALEGGPMDAVSGRGAAGARRKVSR